MKKYIMSTLIAAAFVFSAVNAGASPIQVNGKNIAGDSYKINDTVMLPVRSVAEELGFDVEWDGDTKSIVLSHLPQYVTFTIGVDGYTFAKTAPMPLGQAAEIKNGTAYVPSELFSEILGLWIDWIEQSDIISISQIEYADNVNADEDIKPAEDGDANVNDDSDDDIDAAFATGVVKEISDNIILMEDSVMGEIKLVISDKTPVTDADGNEKSLSDISTDCTIRAELGDAMTMSLPPINNPVNITILK